MLHTAPFTTYCLDYRLTCSVEPEILKGSLEFTTDRCHCCRCKLNKRVQFLEADTVGQYCCCCFFFERLLVRGSDTEDVHSVSQHTDSNHSMRSS